jgi:protein-S-isoprenylcysteine O-methyltransferase Ste14
MTEPPISDPGIRFPPPTLFAAGLLLGWLLNRFIWPLPISRMPGRFDVLAGVLIPSALALMAAGVVSLRRAGTTVLPNMPASRLVRSGPYRFTRNPMYTGFTIAYVGVALLMNTLWPLLLLPVVLFLLVRLVVRREEAYLRSAFGADYDEYRSRVRRWV